MGNTDTSPIFEKAASRIPKDIAFTSSQEIALICRYTFEGIQQMLTADLGDIPYESVQASAVALNRIDQEYSKLLRSKDGLELDILREIQDI